MDEAERNRRRAVCMVHGWVYDAPERGAHRIKNGKDKTLAVGYERGEQWIAGATTQRYLGQPILSSFDEAVRRLIEGGRAYG